VTVAGETELVVLADKPGDAAAMVWDELRKAIRVRVRPAPPELVEKITKAEPRDRPKLLRNHKDVRHASRVQREERRLREYIAHHERTTAYISDLAAKSPPVPPEIVRRVMRTLFADSAPVGSAAEEPLSRWGEAGIVAAAQLPYDDGGAVAGAAVRASPQGTIPRS